MKVEPPKKKEKNEEVLGQGIKKKEKPKVAETSKTLLKKKSDLALHLKSKIAHYASSVMKSFGKDKDEV